MRTTPDQPTTTLPLELILTIFDHSVDIKVDFDTGSSRQQTLASWSLVCRALVRPAQASLFARPVLRRPHQLDHFVRSITLHPTGDHLSGLVRAVRIGGKEGWKQDHAEIFGYSEAVEAVVSSCEALSELYVWGVKEGIHASAIAQGKGEGFL